ncbi:MAG: Asp-tRNA(Asn)/Glu-tRNA(Gln) amidotransferase subunit GatA [Desulfurivibrionaceae bacterium]
MNIKDLTINRLQEMLAGKEVTSAEVTSSVFAHIRETDRDINAFITLAEDEAMAQAEAADRMLEKGGTDPLCGIPLSIKDVLCTRNIKTTAGSRILESFVPGYDATVVDSLKGRGAVLLGKVAMDEFAMGSTNEHCAFGTPRNPWNTDYICGGSSGGSAASVAADQCLATLGSDTGGSIRQPASHCGVVGMKPTYGRVSRYGLIAFASSLDQVGPLTKDVTDCALMMSAIAGHDPKDSTSVKKEVPDYSKALKSGLKGMTIGIPREYFVEGLDPEVGKAVRDALEKLKEAGAETREVSLPHTEYGAAVYYIIAPAEASSNLARYDGVRYGLRDEQAESLIEMYNRSRSRGFGDEVKRRIIIGTYSLSSGYYDAYYKKASQVRALISEDYKKVFQECDLLASPVTPTPPWKIGEKVDDPLSLYLSDVFTIPANLAGIPALSIPCAFSSEHLPIGFQLQAPHFGEESLLRAGYNLEQRLNPVGPQTGSGK